VASFVSSSMRLVARLAALANFIEDPAKAAIAMRPSSLSKQLVTSLRKHLFAIIFRVSGDAGFTLPILVRLLRIR